MKKSVILALLASGIFVLGCRKKAAEPQEASNVVVVAIGDQKLMSADLDADVKKFIEARRSHYTAEQLEASKPYLAQQFKQRFITNTLLLREAAKKGISITDEEVTARVNEIIKSAQGRPGAPTSRDELLAMYPLGPERALEEFRSDLLVRKFVAQEIEPTVVVDPEEVKRLYDQAVSNITERARAPMPEQVRVSHILVRTSGEKTSDAAKAEIDEIHAQLKDLKGAALAKRFAKLAKEKSDCPSKMKDGYLGAISRGQMKPEFDKAAFAQEVGKIYDPVQTSFGWHLILVLEKLPAKTPTDADVEKVLAKTKPKLADVERMIKARLVQQKFQAYVQALCEANGFAQPAATPDKPVVEPVGK